MMAKSTGKSSIIISLLKVKRKLESCLTERLRGPECNTFLLYQPERFSFGYLLSQIDIIKRAYLIKIITEFDVLLLLYFTSILFLDVKFFFPTDQQLKFILEITIIIALLALYIIYLFLFSLIFLLMRLTITPAVRIVSGIAAVTYLRGALLTDVTTMLYTTALIATVALMLTFIGEREETLFSIFRVTLPVVSTVVVNNIIDYLKNFILEKMRSFHYIPENQLNNLYFLTNFLIQNFNHNITNCTISKELVNTYFISTIIFAMPLLFLIFLLQRNKIKLLDNRLLVVISEDNIRKIDLIKAIYNCKHFVYQRIFQEFLNSGIRKIKSIYLIDLNWIIEYLPKSKNLKKIDIYLDPTPIKESNRELFLVRKVFISKKGIASLWISEETLVRLIKLTIHTGRNINEVIREKITDEISNQIFFTELQMFQYMSLAILSVFLVLSVVLCKDVQREKCLFSLYLTFAFILFPRLLLSLFKYRKEIKLRKIIHVLLLLVLLLFISVYTILFLNVEYIYAMLSLSAFVTSCIIFLLRSVIET